MAKFKGLFDNTYANRDDAALDVLPQNMQNMKKLLSLHLSNYLGVSLPNAVASFNMHEELVLVQLQQTKGAFGLGYWE